MFELWFGVVVAHKKKFQFVSRIVPKHQAKITFLLKVVKNVFNTNILKNWGFCVKEKSKVPNFRRQKDLWKLFFVIELWFGVVIARKEKLILPIEELPKKTSSENDIFFKSCQKCCQYRYLQTWSFLSYKKSNVRFSSSQ